MLGSPGLQTLFRVPGDVFTYLKGLKYAGSVDDIEVNNELCVSV